MLLTKEDIRTETVLSLPVMVSPNDIRVVTQYLKKKPDGVSIKDAARNIKKQMLGPEKLASYESLGIISKADDKLKLSELGRELAKRLESETEVFRRVLDSIEPYRGALEWAFRHDAETIVINDIISFWINNFPEALGSGSSQTIKSQVVSFFHLCHAAELGIITIGKRGHPDRLRLDRRELRNHIETLVIPAPGEQDFLSHGHERGSSNTSPKEHPGEAVSMSMKSGTQSPKVYISSRRRDEFVAKVQMGLELANITSIVRTRIEADGLLGVENAYEAMSQCNAAIIILSDADYKKNDKEHELKECVIIEIGVARVLYNRRLVLLRESRLPAPNYLKDYAQYEYVDDQLTWDTGVQILRTLKDFE